MMDTKNNRIHTAVTLLQVVTVIIALIGTLGAVVLTLDGIGLLPWVDDQPLLLAYAIFGFATVAVVSAATYTALYQFFRMCSRLKQGTAFTRANERAMRLIALCCFVGGAMLGAGTVFSLAVNVVLGWCELMLFFTLAYLGVALCAWALHLLLQRAVSMQEEADLTI